MGLSTVEGRVKVAHTAGVDVARLGVVCVTESRSAALPLRPVVGAPCLDHGLHAPKVSGERLPFLAEVCVIGTLSLQQEARDDNLDPLGPHFRNRILDLLPRMCDEPLIVPPCRSVRRAHEHVDHLLGVAHRLHLQGPGRSTQTCHQVKGAIEILLQRLHVEVALLEVRQRVVVDAQRGSKPWISVHGRHAVSVGLHPLNVRQGIHNRETTGPGQGSIQVRRRSLLQLKDGARHVGAVVDHEHHIRIGIAGEEGSGSQLRPERNCNNIATKKQQKRGRCPETTSRHGCLAC
mmetsp:Transcript_16845/g.53900  ORF Transcript_16845/g.53900 Transcript_16845/m.53900 type:complete len:291 (+) Transcript_16845:2143-3015(+)